MQHISCISDTHLTVPDIASESLFPRQLAKMNEAEAKNLYTRIRREIALAYSTCLSYLVACRPWDMIVHLGDITGGYREQGCSHPSAQACVLQVRSDLAKNCEHPRFVVGDHDTGYRHHGSLPQSGISETSLMFLQEKLGSLFWADELEGILHMGICSPIAQYKGNSSVICRLQKQQAEFVGDMLSSGRRWVLYTHRPVGAVILKKEIGGHLVRLKRMVYGHLHDPRKGNLLRIASTLFGLPGSIKLMDNAVMCPSVAPLWWRGYEFLSCCNSDMNFQRILMDRPPESEDIPTSSFWRCLSWMLKPR